MNQADRNYIIAKRFFNDHDVIHFLGTFYLFNEGVWRQESTENTYSWITKDYINAFSQPPLTTHIKEITSMIQYLTYDKYRKQIKYLSEKKEGNTMNIKSGILDLDTLEVKPYTKEDFCFHKLPFDYIDKPKCPTMAKFLTTSMGYDWEGGAPNKKEYMTLMHFIQEWMGYSLITGNPLHKILIMKGDGRNGKGVLQDIWSHILGENNVSHVDIKGINDGSQVFMTKNKLVNFAHDIQSGQQLDTGVMKSAIAGEKVTVNEKYKPQYEMEFTAKIIIACNDTPFIKNTGAAIKERIYILPFDRVFEEHERDYNLKKKLIKEADHIFSWAVKGLKRLTNRGHFISPERCTTSAHQYIKSNDSIEMWIDEDNIYKENEKVERQEAYRSYKWYCEQSGYKPYGKIKFYERIEKKGMPAFASNGKYYFKNMKLPNSSIL